MVHPANPSTFIPGYALEIDASCEYGHYVGGTNEIVGAICPNCEKPLLRHLTLDTTDPALRLDWLGIGELPLLYCGRCALSWEPFVYRLAGSHRVEIARANRGARVWGDWYDCVGVDEFPKRKVGLRPIPSRIQELYSRLNREEDLSCDEESEIAAFTGQYASEEVGGYPIIHAVNQIGGQTFLIQRLDSPSCSNCAQSGGDTRMHFLASLTNDRKVDLVFSWDGVQIVFFMCANCLSIHVQHSS